MKGIPVGTGADAARSAGFCPRSTELRHHEYGVHRPRCVLPETPETSLAALA
jgi:hypothetical protein